MKYKQYLRDTGQDEPKVAKDRAGRRLQKMEKQKIIDGFKAMLEVLRE